MARDSNAFFSFDILARHWVPAPGTSICNSRWLMGAQPSEPMLHGNLPQPGTCQITMDQKHPWASTKVLPNICVKAVRFNVLLIIHFCNVKSGSVSVTLFVIVVSKMRFICTRNCQDTMVCKQFISVHFSCIFRCLVIRFHVCTHHCINQLPLSLTCV